MYLSLIPNRIFYNYEFYRLFTYLFIHIDFNHLLGNSLVILFIGSYVEKEIGSNEFLLLYILIGVLSGLGISIFHLLTNSFVFVIGASASVYALLLAFATIFPRARVNLFFILPIQAPYLILLYIIFEIFSQIFFRDNISHIGHLLGLALAYIYLTFRMRLNPIKVWKMNNIF